MAKGVGTPRTELPIAVTAWAIPRRYESDNIFDGDFEKEVRDNALILFVKWIEFDAEGTPGARSLAEER